MQQRTNAFTQTAVDTFVSIDQRIIRAEARQECEQLDYYRARLQALQQTAEHAARRQAGLPRKLGLAAGMAMALLLI